MYTKPCRRIIWYVPLSIAGALIPVASVHKQQHDILFDNLRVIKARLQVEEMRGVEWSRGLRWGPKQGTIEYWEMLLKVIVLKCPPQID
jgi:hypothetical protein